MSEIKAALIPGVVTATFGKHLLVDLARGEVLECVTRGRKHQIACGDRVMVAHTSVDQGVVEAVDPRSTLFFRSDAYRQKLLAANVTQIIVVAAVEPSVDEELLNRCIVAAEHNQVRVVIVLNKCDLHEKARPMLDTLNIYAELGYPVIPISAQEDAEALRPYLKNNTSILVGQSGMGKSTLINALIPDAAVRTANISVALDSGKHTTTHTRLYHLDANSHIIDSPGLQEFGLHHLGNEEIENAFIEFRPFLGRCKFRDCQHMSEPGCAILQAITDGKISERRFMFFRKMIK